MTFYFGKNERKQKNHMEKAKRRQKVKQKKKSKQNRECLILNKFSLCKGLKRMFAQAEEGEKVGAFQIDGNPVAEYQNQFKNQIEFMFHQMHGIFTLCARKAKANII